MTRQNQRTRAQQPQLAFGTPQLPGRSARATPRARSAYMTSTHHVARSAVIQNRRSCAFVGTSPASSGVASNDISPAAAAHASK